MKKRRGYGIRVASIINHFARNYPLAPQLCVPYEAARAALAIARAFK